MTPPPQALGHGIYQIALPLPFKSPPWVNVYVVESTDGLLMIDCGADWDDGHRALHRGFRDLRLDLRQVHTLVVSHLHPDHVGMSTRVVSALGCRFVMHERAANLVDRYNDTPGFISRMEDLARRHGVPEDVISLTTSRSTRPDYMPVISPPDTLVADGDAISLGDGRSLRVLHTPGHEPSHICLVDSKSGALFSGDHVLPRISPVVMYDELYDDVLGDYLDSLQRLVKGGFELTFPAHGTIVEHGAERALQIMLHHRRRLTDMAQLVEGRARTAWDVMIRSFRPNLEPLQARLAFLETISHLEHLVLDGPVSREIRDEVSFYVG